MAAAPDARRLRRRRWTQPRVLVGVLLAVLCAVGVAWLVDRSDDTVAVWSVRADVRAGEPAAGDQLRAVRVRLDGDTRARYLPVEAHDREQVVRGRGWSRGLGAGELVPRSALAAAGEAADAEVPVRVERGAFPDDLATGDRVQVFAGPGESGAAVADADTARRVADDVRVVSVGRSDAALGDTGPTTVLLAVDDGALADLVAAIDGARVTLVRTPAGGGA